MGAVMSVTKQHKPRVEQHSRPKPLLRGWSHALAGVVSLFAGSRLLKLAYDDAAVRAVSGQCILMAGKSGCLGWPASYPRLDQLRGTCAWTCSLYALA